MEPLYPRVSEIAASKSMTLMPTQVRYLEAIDTAYEIAVQRDRFFPLTINFGQRSGITTLFSLIQATEPGVAIVNISPSHVKRGRDVYACMTVRDLEDRIFTPAPADHSLVLFDFGLPYGFNQHTGWWATFIKLLDRLELLRQLAVIA